MNAPSPPPAVPRATYRIQLTKNFTFDDAAALVPYLSDLGITHLYASPFLKARPGSTHGYDIVDHDRLNPELGGDEAFDRLSDALRQNGLGLILDFVPNHMGVGHADNAWWLDVLEWGQRSRFAIAFDIDWEGLPYRRHPGVLLPILGRPYGEALQAGEIELKYDPETGSFAAWYFDNKLPINPQRYGEMLRTIVTAAGAFDELPGQRLIALAQDYRNPDQPSYREAGDLKARLAAIKDAAGVIERGLVAYRAGSEAGAANLHRLLERQNYLLAFWRVAFSSINYRRFFDINDLAGLRVENFAVFRAIHRLVARLIGEKKLHGLRLDHIDGLRDPAQYTQRLTQMIRKLPGGNERQGPFYVLVEKILEESEEMPPRLPGVAGTTGYEWLNTISRVLANDRGLDPLEHTWREFTGETRPFQTMLEAAKLRVINTMLASEFTVLGRALARIAAGHLSTRDYTLDRLRVALQAYVIEFPVYRTYLTAAGASPTDRKTIEDIISRTRANWDGPDPEIFDFLRGAITLDLTENPGYSKSRVRNFALKLQQFTGPLMAKAMEDTVFYRYHRLLALNEVGGEPDARALTLDGFHALQQKRMGSQPDSLTATATHDTKRGEDARARIFSLTELSNEWDEAINHWQGLNAALTQQTNGKSRPSKAHQYMIYQALIGAWPKTVDDIFVKRMQAYALKAAREGKQDTSWTNPNEEYEAALREYLAKLLDPNISAAFLASFGQFAARTSLIGALNSLTQLTLKTLLPGVPDFYQGTEFWDFSLVDPDNRRPVDFNARRQALRAETADWANLATHWPDGHIKLALTRRLLQIRRDHAELFQRGGYEPIAVTGPQSDHVIAFARSFKGQKIVIATGRHFASLTDGGNRWLSGIDARLDLDASYEDLLGMQAQQASSAGFDLNLSFRTVPVCVLRRL